MNYGTKKIKAMMVTVDGFTWTARAVLCSSHMKEHVKSMAASKLTYSIYPVKCLNEDNAITEKECQACLAEEQK